MPKVIKEIQATLYVTVDVNPGENETDKASDYFFQKMEEAQGITLTGFDIVGTISPLLAKTLDDLRETPDRGEYN